MKVTKILLSTCLSAALVFSGVGCSSGGGMSSQAKGTMIGAGAGAVVGAGAGVGIAALSGKNKKKGAIIGAATGAVVGGVAGNLIGKKMDKKKAELAALNAQVETEKDQNGLESIKVTFGENGIKFATGKSDLSKDAQTNLAEFASKMSDMTDTDITVLGHTDATGSDAVNDKISNERAAAVANYLASKGIASSRIQAYGMGSSDPVDPAKNATAYAKNRRVEVYITANKAMIEAAEAGKLE